MSNWNCPPLAKILRIFDFTSNLEHFSNNLGKKKLELELEPELPAAGENFQNSRFFFEFAALFQQSGKKNWRGPG
ncbi:MAG: hypothetical protein GY820_25795 [Gammaproteobacteria bacterium]|nr:hypothetical protein [Gammaproteobacteria bacterium]